MSGTATLFDADAASHSATVEVLGVIFSAEDDGYAVLEVQDAETGEGFALVGPVARVAAPESVASRQARASASPRSVPAGCHRRRSRPVIGSRPS